MMFPRNIIVRGMLLLMACSLSIISCAVEVKGLTGSWVLESQLPVYYRFNENNTFVVNFVNPQTKRVMAVSGGSFIIDGNRLSLHRDNSDEVLTQEFDINEDQMTWVTITDVKGYDDKVLLKRTKVDLYTPEDFYADDNKNIYDTYLK